jgi:hypothetical protein
MPRIFPSAALLVAAVFAGALMGRAHRRAPRPAQGKALFQKPGSINRRRPRSSTRAGTATWKIVKDIDHSNDTHRDYLRALAPIC